MNDATHAPTPGQTVGPFFHFGLDYPLCHEIVSPDAPGAVSFRGTVVDGAGEPVPDALLEIWQPDPSGLAIDQPGHIARDGSFTGFGRASTNSDGEYGFTTLAPGPTHEGGAPFLAVAVFARGLLDRLFTRIYLPSTATESDAFLQSLDPKRRATLMARADGEAQWRWDIVLQGDNETVFLDFSAPAATERTHG